ncbi:nuclear transport factor 2 family protein [Mycolicibacterium sp. 120266]|uniref:nuclear transport factor 2 family protein n=1 Tax=Mycolicibacterium sp. 120266 TaxID=3090601 RepID=UPI00299D5AE7|nr:nuclear transport factor 2 family protein [Mycolicibacterium sp. 120266]MDX1872364.1 nuclear transport factor 2 family protein [Mycolicibacterium sp. 120266]
MSAEDTVRRMWKALSDRNWAAVKAELADDCIYADMPVGPAASARGPEDIVKRLKIGLEPLASYVNHDGPLVAAGDTVMYEHSETWEWRSGETALLRFVSVHEVRDDRITLWKDYWDMGALVNFAPSTWMAELARSDMSWIYDATGQI